MLQHKSKRSLKEHKRDFDFAVKKTPPVTLCKGGLGGGGCGGKGQGFSTGHRFLNAIRRPQT